MNHNYIIKDMDSAHVWAEGVRFAKEQYGLSRRFDPVRVQYKYKHWSIKYKSGHSNEYSYTYFESKVHCNSKFNLDIGTENFVTKTMKFFGHSDVIIGDRNLDNELFISSNAPDIAKQVLNSTQVLQILKYVPTGLQIRTRGRKTRKRLIISWETDGIIEEVSLLKDFFKLFSLLLDRLKQAKVID